MAVVVEMPTMQVAVAVVTLMMADEALLNISIPPVLQIL